MGWTPLPIGIENYAEMIEKGYYYVDKTMLIKELLDKKGKVNLFTRPRRFGKTLNMSMLQYFFEKSEKDCTPLFTGTKIMQTGEKYLSEMGRYPVIFLSLKSMKQDSYSAAFYCLKESIASEFKRHLDLLRQLPLEEDFDKCRRFATGKAEDTEYLTALRFLSECLFAICQTKTVILIDEYDVPLENAYFHGFYDRMAGLVRSLFESALKTNNTLEFAVITGCLRISKESIFKPVHEDITYDDMDSTQNHLWNFLFFYRLSEKNPPDTEGGRHFCGNVYSQYRSSVHL